MWSTFSSSVSAVTVNGSWSSSTSTQFKQQRDGLVCMDSKFVSQSFLFFLLTAKQYFSTCLFGLGLLESAVKSREKASNCHSVGTQAKKRRNKMHPLSPKKDKLGSCWHLKKTKLAVEKIYPYRISIQRDSKEKCQKINRKNTFFLDSPVVSLFSDLSFTSLVCQRFFISNLHHFLLSFTIQNKKRDFGPKFKPFLFVLFFSTTQYYANFSIFTTTFKMKWWKIT